MPLLNLVGITANNKLFYAGSMFMPSEIERDFIIALEFLKKDCDFRESPYPEVFLTDADLAQMKAIKNVFLNAIQLLCMWHINEKIYAKIKPLLKSEWLLSSADDDDKNDLFQIGQFLKEKWNLIKAEWMHAVAAGTAAEWEAR